MADFRINVVVDSSGVVTGTAQVGRSLQRVENSADRVNQALRRAFALVGIGTAVRQLATLSDSFIELRNRALIANDGFGDVTETIDQLTGVALRTRAPVAELTLLFQRGALAARELGASQEELFTFLEAVGQSLAIQGGAVSQARGAIIQLSQALGSVNVRAEEFNSIQEGAFPILQAAARGIDEAGGSVVRLRRLVIEGEITSRQFFEGILDQANELGETFSLTEPTIRQAFIVLQSGLVRSAEELEKLAGPLAEFIRDVGLAIAVLAGIDPAEIAPPSQVARIVALSETLENLGRTAVAVGVLFAVNLARTGIGFAIAAINSLTLAIRANPLGALASALVLAVSAATAFADRISITSDEFISLQAFGQATFEALSSAVSSFVDFFRTSFSFVSAFIETVFGDAEFSILGLLTTTARVVDGIIALFRGSVAAIGALFSRLPGVIQTEFERAFTEAEIGAVEAINSIITVINSLNERVGLDLLPLLVPPEPVVNRRAQGLGRVVNEAFAEGFNRATPAEAALNDIIDRAREIQEQSEAITEAPVQAGPDRPPFAPGSPEFDEVLADLRQEAELLRLTNNERRIAEALLDIEDDLKRDLTATEQEQVEALLRANQELARQADILEEIQGPLMDATAAQDSLRTLFDEGRISAQEFIEAMRELNVELTELDNTVTGGLENGLARIAQRANELGRGVSDIVVGAFDRATDAIVEFARTGTFNFREFVGSILEQIIRLTTNQLFAQFITLLGGGGPGAGTTSSIGAIIGGGIGGGFGGNVGTGGAGGLLAGIFTGLAGFQTGAQGVPVNSLAVGNLSGTDNRLVAFRARSDETIDVNRRGEGNGGRPIVVNINVQTPDADSFRRSQSDILLRTQTALQRARDRSGG